MNRSIGADLREGNWMVQVEHDQDHEGEVRGNRHCGMKGFDVHSQKNSSEDMIHGSFNRILLQLIPEHPLADPELFRSPGLNAAGLFQCFQDNSSLDGIKRLVQRAFQLLR